MKEALSAKEIFIAFLFSLLVTISITLVLNYSVINSLVSPSHSFFKDVLFVNITFMGDAVFAFGAVALLLFFLNRTDLSIRLLFSVLVALFITQSIKNIFSNQAVHLYFEPGTSLDTDTEKNIISSHVAVAFTVALFFSLHFKNTAISAVLFILALAVAYSRVYVVGDSMTAVFAGLLPAGIAVFSIYRIAVYKNVQRHYKAGNNMKQSDRNFIPV